MLPSCLPLLLFCALPAVGQVTPVTDRIPGPPPDEYVDVTGDGIADLLITSRTIHISDPQRPGYLGKYMLGVRTMAGTAILMWSTPSNQRWYTLENSTRLDTSLLAARIHFKQLSWTDDDHPTEFWLLERPFGPAITKEQDGWYGTGDLHDGLTLVLRSESARGTSVAAFAFELPYPYGRIAIKVKHAVRVPNGFGDEGDPVPTKPKVVDEYDFGHEACEPQVVVPPGIPPDERVNLNSDEVDDLVITGHLEQGRGENAEHHFVRGLSPLPGTEFLMTRERWGVLGFFYLGEGGVLTPERLAAGLESNLFVWADADTAHVFIPILRHAVGSLDQESRWALEEDALRGALVYRTEEYDQTLFGTLEIIAHTPGGEFGLRPQTWVEEGQVLQVH